MPSDLPSKQEHLLALLERGSVFVHLDPRREGVMVPPSLGRNPQLVLQLGLNFAIPIPDLEVDDEGVRCTLSFNRTPFYCCLPWTAVYALVSEDGQVRMWRSELPSELVPATSPVRKTAPTPRDRRTRTRPSISVVPPPVEGDAKELDTPSRKPRSIAPTAAPPSLVAPPSPKRPSLLPQPDAALDAPVARAKTKAKTADGRKQGKARPPYLRLVK